MTESHSDSTILVITPFPSLFLTATIPSTSLATATDRLVKISPSHLRMPDAKLRQAIAFEAARLMYSRSESEYYTAKRKAAKLVCRGYVKPTDLPSNAEIRDLIQTFARTHEGDRRTENLRDMRLRALGMMRLLKRYRPRLIGSVLTGHTRQGSDIDLHLFSDSITGITDALDAEGMRYEVEHKEITKNGDTRVFTHVHLFDVFAFEFTVYAENQAHYVFKSSITGKAIERASINELEQFLVAEYPGIDLEAELAETDESHDPYPLFKLMLQPLEQVKQHPKWHPEGDALFHSLQVFKEAKGVRPWDEEFLLAALLHDVGKGIDASDHVGAAMQVLDGLVTERTGWLIENHMVAMEYVNGTLGHRQKKRLQENEDFEELLLLRECDTRGRNPSARVGTVDEALAYIQEVERSNRGG